MSAYVVDRDVIAYLMSAALSPVIAGRHGISWIDDDGEMQNLRVTRYDMAADVGQMLWYENIKSVQYRYPDTTDDDMPGPIGESFLFTRQDVTAVRWSHIDPVQVIKTAQHYIYQACEHPDWEQSEAYRFIDALINKCIYALPGYDAAAYGAPDPDTNNTRRLF